MIVAVVGLGKPPMSQEMKDAISKAAEVAWGVKEKPMKYFRITAYTPYCGEELVAVAKAADEHELRSSGFPDEVVCDCAAEWFNGEDYETYGYESEEEYEEMFYQECGCEIEEITKEEYEEEKERF